MQTLDNVRFALRALRDNRMRTVLTALGVVIGVAAVVAAIGIGQSAFGVVLESVGGLGSNLLYVIPGNPQTRFGPGNFAGPVTSLTIEDNDALLRQTRGLVARSSPAVRKPLQVTYRTKKWLTSLAGVLPDYEGVNNHHVRRGRFITMEDSEGRARVAVVGRTVLENLFGSPDAEPLGEEIEVNRVKFRIVGILEKKGALFSSDQDDIVMVPLMTAMRRVMNQNYLSFIALECNNPDVMDLAAEKGGALLRRRHRLRPPFPDNDDFAIRSQAAALETLGTVSRTLTTVLGGIAAISLTVGGIGIMNIMLVSVTERTREIGIRKALGATQKLILQQFLVESALISLLGGLIGLGLGTGLTAGVSALFGWKAIISLTAVVVAVTVSAGIGIFFGIWPAKKAARLNPIDALRRE
jgi:putative ABC transport system permease protein